MGTRKGGATGRQKSTSKAKSTRRISHTNLATKTGAVTNRTKETPSEILCCICGRVLWGRAQPLGYGKWRHGDCAPGSPEWRAYFERLPKSQQTEEGRIIYKHHET